MRTAYLMLALAACSRTPEAARSTSVPEADQKDWGVTVGRLMPDQLRNIAEQNLALPTDGGEHSSSHHKVAVTRSDVAALGGVPFIHSETQAKYAPTFFGALFAGQALQNGFCAGVVRNLALADASDASVRTMGKFLWGVAPADDELPDLKGLVDDAAAAADAGWKAVPGLELVCAAMLDDPRFQLY